jgi:hypothetical protein
MDRSEGAKAFMCASSVRLGVRAATDGGASDVADAGPDVDATAIGAAITVAITSARPRGGRAVVRRRIALLGSRCAIPNGTPLRRDRRDRTRRTP